MPAITINDGYLFWEFLENNHRHLYLRLRPHRLAPGDVVAVRPWSMTDQLYEEYKKILYEWLLTRGLLDSE